MQIPSFLWIVLCLIAVTSSRTARSTYNETGDHGSPLKSLQEDEDTVTTEEMTSTTTDKDCDCGGTFPCKYENGKKVCNCGRTFAQKDGKCEFCDCGEYSLLPSCKFENGDKVCFCFNGYTQKDGKCETCDCGGNAWSCKYENEEKVCDCRYGYQDINGKCESCDCGENTWSCKYENEEKVCDCRYGYQDINGKCEKISISSTVPPTVTTTVGPIGEICDCGKNSLSCKYENGKKVCNCERNYADKDGKCEHCECGEYSLHPSCIFENGKKVCNCRSRYAHKDGKCETCDCGENTWYCKYENEEKVCDCRYGYQDINGKCEKISISSTVPPTVTTTVGPSGEKIDVYLVTLVAVSVFSSIVLMFVACVMCQRYCVMRISLGGSDT